MFIDTTVQRGSNPKQIAKKIDERTDLDNIVTGIELSMSILMVKFIYPLTFWFQESTILSIRLKRLTPKQNVHKEKGKSESDKLDLCKRRRQKHNVFRF